MFGLMRGVQVCLPLIRQSQGRVITTTSGLAKMAVPTRSPYVFTKYALVGFMDVLRYEMEGFGVKVGFIIKYILLILGIIIYIYIYIYIYSNFAIIPPGMPN